MFTLAEQNRRDRQEHFVDLSGFQVLTNDGHTAADSHFLALGCLFRFLQKSKNRVGRTLRKRRP